MIDNKKIALITGITGQDGSLLAELLLSKGYVVHGIKRRSSSFNTNRIDHLYKDRHDKDARLFLHFGDLSDSSNIIRIIQETNPTEIYNLGAMSHVHTSFQKPEYTSDIDALGALRILEAVRILGKTNQIKFYQASSSELYGNVQEIPQNEKTPFYPRSPYAVAKLYAYWITVNYREAYNMFASNGILFNHESPSRGETFVTRKITRAVANIALGFQNKLFLGNLDARRDWGHARDYVRAMYLMLQQDKPDDFVIATGESVTVREFATRAFSQIGINIVFEGKGLKEIGKIESIDHDFFFARVNQKSGHLKEGNTLIEVKDEYFRPAEVHELLGDSSKARNMLKWKPEINLGQLISEMVESDLGLLNKYKFLKDHGHKLTDLLQSITNDDF